MADIDLMPARGVPFRAEVDANGIAVGGTLNVAQLASRGMRAFCRVDNAGLAGAVTIEQLAQRGIRAACLVDENGLASGVTADELRRRGIRPVVALTSAGLSGSTTMQQLAQRGLDYACLVNESGAASGGLTTYVTWDAATVTSVTLSDGNLVATNTGTTSVDQGARVASASGKTAGKYYYEITWTTVTSPAASNLGVGIGTTTSTYTGMGNGATTGTIVYRSGNIWTTGGNTGLNTVVSFGTSGSMVGIAVDLDNRKMWFRNVSSGNWNGNVANNPATNVGGVTIPAGTMIPFVMFGGGGGVSANVFTANFGASDFVGTVPAGFTSGWPQ